MATQTDRGAPSKQKHLACKRCRHRKQKCTETRPCENCIRSGSDCIPYEPMVSKPLLETDYVQRLEERIAQLESTIPQERMDHLNAAQSSSPRRMRGSSSGPGLRPTVEVPFDHADDHGDQAPWTTEHTTNGRNAADNLHTPSSLLDGHLDLSNHGLFGAMSGIDNPFHSARQSEVSAEAPELGAELERFLIRTYFDMAHPQYPILLKHEFVQWAESWRDGGDTLPASMRWKGFFVYMVYAVAFLMAKSRINGSIRSRTFYSLATSKYVPYVMTSPSPLIRAQGFLLLALYALHVPSQEAIIALSSRAIRFCVASQLHLAETEPEPLDADSWMEVQHRRRVFWCAYTIDRIVCSAYNLPCSISDRHISVPLFVNIDDDQLRDAAESVDVRSRLLASNSPTEISSLLHIIVGRQIESDIQNTMLHTDFVADSGEAFAWRTETLEKLKQWNRNSAPSTVPSQRGYASLRWHKMIYYHSIVMLYRPTRASARGLSGDLSVQACCQALLLFRKFHMAREIARPWLGLLTQFQIGVTLLYCFFATPPSLWPASYKSTDVADAIRACSSILAVLAERWAEVECIRDIFEILAKEIPLGETWERPRRISEAGRTVIDENWKDMSGIVIHRPTLHMITEMASGEFVDAAEIDAGDRNYVDARNSAAAANSNIMATDPATAAFDIFDGMDTDWSNPMSGTSPLGIDPRFYFGSEIEAFADESLRVSGVE